MQAICIIYHLTCTKQFHYKIFTIKHLIKNPYTCMTHPVGSVEQYTGYVVIPQYWFLIASNILNTVIP